MDPGTPETAGFWFQGVPSHSPALQWCGHSHARAVCREQSGGRDAAGRFSAALLPVRPARGRRWRCPPPRTVEIATTEFVDEIRTTGKITPNAYNRFLTNIGSTGNAYNVEMEVRVLDENPKRKNIQNNTTGTKENVYYSVYNSQIETALEANRTFYLKEGDIVTVSAKNSNQTIAQQLKNFFYKVIGKDIYTIASSHSGMIVATGR